MVDPKTLDKLNDEGREMICPDCKSKNIGYKDGERYCKDCGLVLD